VLDVARLGLIVAPIFMAVCAAFWGWHGLASSLLALVLVVGNLALGALIIERAVRISLTFLMGAVLGGFLVRLILLALIVLPIRQLSWFTAVPFGISLVGGHLVLLAWESQRVSTTLSSPNTAPADSPFTSAGTRSESE
jgi:hypothetical protein